MNVIEYLQFEKSCGRLMNQAAKKINRKKYGVTEDDLKMFYGQESDYKDKYNKVNVKKKKEAKPKFSEDEITEQLELFKKIFDNEDESFVRIRCKYTDEFYSYPVKALLSKDKLYSILNSHRFNSINDLMYSLNTYNNMYKMNQNTIFTINSFAIDLDFKEVRRYAKYTAKQVISILEKTEFDKTVPRPNVIEHGNNIRLIYTLKKAYSTRNVNTLVTRICKTIGERLADYGASGQPITTFGRVVNSVNSRNGKKIKIMYLEQPKYIIKNLKNDVLPALPQWYAEYKQKTTRKRTRVIDFSNNFSDRAKARSYNLNRISDLFKIVQHFDGDIDGRRFLCFQVRNHAKLAGLDDEEAEDIMKKLNESFKYPLRWNVIEQDTRNVNHKQYYYKSQSILDYLCIDPELELLLDLSAILSSTEYKRRENERVKAVQKAKYRNQEGLTNQEIQRRDEFILWSRMELKGMSYKAMARELGYTHHNRITRKINREYDKINYSEILEEVKLGLYNDIEVVTG
ncbi:hypothetical protein ACV3XQ_16175 [Clostridium perfringens]